MENCSLSSGFQASNLVTGFHNIPHVDIDLNRIPADFQITLDYFEASLETLTFGIISYCSSWMVFPPIQFVLHCTWNYSGALLGFLNVGLSVTVGCCCLVFVIKLLAVVFCWKVYCSACQNYRKSMLTLLTTCVAAKIYHRWVWHAQISWRKFSWVALKPRNSWKFSPSKVFCYTVCNYMYNLE